MSDNECSLFWSDRSGNYIDKVKNLSRDNFERFFSYHNVKNQS